MYLLHKRKNKSHDFVMITLFRKRAIRILQAQNILQDQKIDKLARFLNLTASRVRLHDKQIYNLQA